MTKITIQYVKTHYGELVLGSSAGKLCLCDWRYRKMRARIDSRLENYLDARLVEGNCSVITATIDQLGEYFNFSRKSFDIPLLLAGTDFQKSVWRELMNVPFGGTMSYLELAKKLGNEKAVRAVASANGANAISIIIPCHRIVGSSGELVGYAGGLDAKGKLLKLEQSML